MTLARTAVGAVLCLVGVVWIGQGVGLIGGSFMTGEAVWAVIGAVTLLVGAAVIRGGRRRREEEAVPPDPGETIGP